jgi:hypothetical protein
VEEDEDTLLDHYLILANNSTSPDHYLIHWLLYRQFTGYFTTNSLDVEEDEDTLLDHYLIRANNSTSPDHYLIHWLLYRQFTGYFSTNSLDVINARASVDAAADMGEDEVLLED